MADFDAQQPVRAIATEFTTEVANASGTTINPVEEFAQASTTSGQSGALVQGAVTTAAPTYTTGTTNPLSLDTSGNLRVAATITPSGTQNVNITEVGGNAVTTTVPVSGTVTVQQPTGSNLHVDVDNFPATQPVSGTVTANQGTPNTLANAWPVEVTDGTNVLGTSSHPVRVDPTGTTTQPVSGTVTANQGGAPWSVNNTQIDGTAISVNTGNADAGTQRVVLATNQPTVPVSFGIPGTPTLDYATSASVATSGTATHSVAGPITLDSVEASASGEMKVTIAYGTTGSEATVLVGFTSASNPMFKYQFSQPIVIASGSSVKLTLKNRDTSAMDVYSTIAWH